VVELVLAEPNPAYQELSLSLCHCPTPSRPSSYLANLDSSGKQPSVVCQKSCNVVSDGG